eukprot:SAG22_NODE_1018_length_6008_cov_5.640887_2_plen_330_part_00
MESLEGVRPMSQMRRRRASSFSRSNRLSHMIDDGDRVKIIRQRRQSRTNPLHDLVGSSSAVLATEAQNVKGTVTLLTAAIGSAKNERGQETVYRRVVAEAQSQPPAEAAAQLARALRGAAMERDSGSHVVAAAEKLLADGADPGLASSPNGWNALHIAAAYNNPATVARLLSAGVLRHGGAASAAAASFLDSCVDGVTALYIAAQQGHEKVVTKLAGSKEQPLADLNKPRQGLGTTPLFIACQKGHWKVVKALLAAGADPDKVSCKALSVFLLCFHRVSIYDRAFLCGPTVTQGPPEVRPDPALHRGVLRAHRVRGAAQGRRRRPQQSQ